MPEDRFMTYKCPVCFYPQMLDPPEDYNICPCCGTEFGNDDAEASHSELRRRWVSDGARWFFEIPPPGWNPFVQLLAGQGYFEGYLPGQYPRHPLVVRIVNRDVSVEPVRRQSDKRLSTEATDTVPLMRMA